MTILTKDLAALLEITYISPPNCNHFTSNKAKWIPFVGKKRKQGWLCPRRAVVRLCYFYTMECDIIIKIMYIKNFNDIVKYS